MLARKTVRTYVIPSRSNRIARCRWSAPHRYTDSMRRSRMIASGKSWCSFPVLNRSGHRSCCIIWDRCTQMRSGVCRFPKALYIECVLAHLASEGVKMKLPRSISTYCPYCKKHSDHEVERVKKKKASEMKWGQRRFRRATSGYGGFPRPKPEGREKPTRRVALRYRCKKCKKAHQKQCFKAKKFEIME